MDSLANRDFSFDIGKLLTPITDANPSGESLRYDAVYDEIREARREDDPVLDRGVWKMALKKSDWSVVEQLCIDALTTRTKDLQIAAWLLEAWLRLYGLPGLRDGFRLLNALSEDFWDSIHPLPEDSELEYRIAPFEWANEKLPLILKLAVVTNPQTEAAPPYSWADWETACRQGNDTITQESFQQSVILTTTEDLTVLQRLTDQAINVLNGLSATLDRFCGSYAPGLGQLSAVLTSIRGLLQSSLSQRPTPEANEEKEEAPMPVDPHLQDPDESIESGALTAGPIRTRAEAYRRLSEAADFLARTEPHSPTPYLVKRAINWGGMKFEDLLPELVRNDSDLSEIHRLLRLGKYR
jgi:type VI secretion system protein ImpA